MTNEQAKYIKEHITDFQELESTCDTMAALNLQLHALGCQLCVAETVAEDVDFGKWTTKEIINSYMNNYHKNKASAMVIREKIKEALEIAKNS